MILENNLKTYDPLSQWFLFPIYSLEFTQTSATEKFESYGRELGTQLSSNVKKFEWIRLYLPTQMVIDIPGPVRVTEILQKLIWVASTF